MESQTNPVTGTTPKPVPWLPDTSITDDPGSVWEWTPRDKLDVKPHADKPEAPKPGADPLDVVLAVISGLVAVVVTATLVRTILHR